MKYLSLTFILILFYSMSCNANSFSLFSKTKIIVFIEGKKEYNLGSQNIIVNSVQIIAEGKELSINTDFHIDYKKGIVKFLNEFPKDTEIIVNYKTFGDNLIYHHYLYKSKKILQEPNKYDIETDITKTQHNIQETNLNISGAKSIGISIGNKEDMSLDQSLFLQIDGELTKGLFVEAQLSDNISPIAPEGTSQKLSNLDKVMIKIYSADYSLTFGDFDIHYKDTHFANYKRKLEGAIFRWESENKVDAAISISTGNFTSNKFAGIEGKQGPYYLTAATNEQVKVIAGSETIYLNGEKMQRGSDYTIDYSEGSITFKNRRLITENSIIIADFEYSAEDFRSNFYLSSTSYTLLNSPLKIDMSFRMLYDKDDKDNPLNTSFSASDKDILSDAGDNELLARKTGVVKMDTTGKGNYIFVDEDTISYYKYVGYDSTGDYTVSFTYVGEANGSYNRISIDEFEWVGENMGSYIPEIQLPIPKQNLNLDAGLKFQFGDFSLYSEGIFTNFDKNTFSNIDNNDNKGYAMFHNLKFQKKLSLLEHTELGIYYEFKDKYFHPITRIEKSSDEYNLYEFVEVDSVNKAKFGGNCLFHLTKHIKNQTCFYYQKMGNKAEMKNLQNIFNYYQNTAIIFLPSLNYKVSKTGQEINNDSISTSSIDKITHNLLGKYNVWYLESSAAYDYKKFISTGENTFGHKEHNYLYHLGTDKLKNTKLSIQYNQENIYDYVYKNWQKCKIANTIKGKIYQNWDNTNIQIDFTHRENEYLSSAEKNSKFDLVEAEITNKLWKKLIYNKVNYNIKNLEEYPKIRELVYVGEGKGLYDSTGTYESGGNYDYEITRIGTPQLTIDLQVVWNLRIEPKQYFYQKKYPLAKFLNKFIFDSYVSIYEKSSYPGKLKIYTLSPYFLMNENYTIYGSQKYRQQVWYNIKKNRIISKFLYEKTKQMDKQYKDVYDRLCKDDYNLQLDFYNVKGWNFKNSVEFCKEKETRYNSISKVYAYTLDMGYRIGYNFLLANKIKYAFEYCNEIDGLQDYRIYSYGIEPKITYNIQQKYRIFSKFSYQKNHRIGSDYLSSVMFNKRDGTILNWLIQFDYKINKFTTMFFSYNGEKYPKVDTRHQIKMELKAVF